MNKIDRQAREQQMQQHIQTWQKSGQTQQEYCKQNSLGFHTFYYWLKRFRDRERVPGIDFVPLRIKDHRLTPIGSLEIQYPNGVRLSVPSSMDVRLLSKLIRLI
jgi:hypothetical protein